jgi:hypothetical protein
MKSTFDKLRAGQPQLFADAAITVDAATVNAMAEIIAAIESVVALPAWRSRVLAWAPQIARCPVAARGVFLGYDFHLTDEGPQLIEINTNAGGGLINAYLLAAHGQAAKGARVMESFVAMFREEWRRERGDAALRRIAIVDENPGEQFLAAEFALFAELFEEHGIAAVIVDPRDLARDGNRLAHGGDAVDLVYNRLTDFSLDAPVNAELRAVFEAGGVVLTPHPPAHALYADKRNLMLLSDACGAARSRRRRRDAAYAAGRHSAHRRGRPGAGRAFLEREEALVLQAARRLRQSRGVSWRQADAPGLRGNPARRLYRAGNRPAVGTCRDRSPPASSA